MARRWYGDTPWSGDGVSVSNQAATRLLDDLLSSRVLNARTCWSVANVRLRVSLVVQFSHLGEGVQHASFLRLLTLFVC